MLNVGITELLAFGIIAILILGPEKLPEAARFAAKWYGKFKKIISNVQNQIDQELHLSKFRQEVQKEIDRLTEFELRLQQQVDQLKVDVQSSEKNLDDKKNQSFSKPIPKLKQFDFQFFSQSLQIPFTLRHLQFDEKLIPKLEDSMPLTELRIAV